MRPATNPDGLTPHEVREHLEAALASPPFGRAARLQRFLRFVAEAALQEREDDLKEYVIGVSVYDRPATFDPAEQSLVRVEANRLRSRLATYYEGEGRGSAVEIQLPRGSYAPVFRRRQPAAEAARGRGEDRSGALAVLPFVNLSADVENEYFADGLTEELIDAFSRAPDLSVVARTSSFQFKNRAVDAREIGRRLDARWILDGSVRRSGLRLRVTARLVDAATGQQVWAERIERRLEDVFEVQDEITAAVVSSLHRRLAAPGRRTHDLQAYQLYLIGRYCWNKRTPALLRKSLACFREAIARDPEWPLPYCGLADAYGVQALNGTVDTVEAMREGTAAARRAIDLDPDLPEAHTSLGFLLSTLHWDWSAGEAAFRRVTAARPSASTAHYLYGMTNLGPQGRWREALREMEDALAVDPVALPVMRDYGVLLFLRRDHDAALAQFRHVEDVDPSFVGVWYWMGRLLEEQGRYPEALAAYRRRLDAGEANDRLLASIAGVRVAMGERESARAELARLSANGAASPLARAIVHIRLGERAEALDVLEQACAERRPELYQLKVDPLFDSLRDQPRFAALLARLNLADA